MPERVERAIMRCLEKDPALRFASAEELAAALAAPSLAPARELAPAPAAAPEREHAPAPAAAPARELAPAPAAAPTRRFWTAGIVAALVVAVAISAGLWYRHAHPPLPGRRNLVVLPFETVGGSPDDRFTMGWIDGNRHRRIGARPHGERAVFGTGADSREALDRRGAYAGFLGASMVLEANLHHIGNQVRIILKLVDARTYQQLRTETFDELWERSVYA